MPTHGDTSMSRILSFAAALSLLATAPLAAQSEEFGAWKSLFNGKDVSGWIAAKPDGSANQKKNVWKAENGTLTNGGSGKNDLCTVEEFEDYELEIEYKIPPKGNSGVYLRGQIEVQIFDSAGKKEIKNVDAGAIYGGNFVALVNAQKPPGEWNKYRVLHVGHRITVWHNGVLIQDNIYADKQTGGAMKKYPGRSENLTTAKGPLMLQGDHGHTWYRNIRIRPLFTDGSGWRSIWNGKDLSAFTSRRKNEDVTKSWAVKDHSFYNSKWGGKGGRDMWTKEEFGNFLAYYSYRSNPAHEGGNSGFYLRDQWEIQILSNQNATPKGKHSDGALYSIYPPLTNARHAKDQWNHVFVKVFNMRIWVWQNGKLIHDGRVCATRTDNHGVATTGFSRGAFKIQGDHGQVHFSQLMIKPLPDTRHAD